MAIQQNLTLEPAQYAFDSSSLILLRSHYPEDVFPKLHSHFCLLLKSGKIVLNNYIMTEIKSEQEIVQMIKDNIPNDRLLKYERYLLETQMIVRKHYDGHGQTHKLRADPHLISIAKSETLTIVTNELSSTPLQIPTIALKEGVKCIEMVEFLRKENFVESW